MNSQVTNDQATADQTIGDQNREQLSALMDGELPRDQLRFLLRRMDGDVSLVQHWSRYHVVSLALRHRYVHFARSEQFAAGVMARLDAESTVTLPRRAGIRALRWAGGGAIAAAVAVVALVVSRPAGEGTTLSASPAAMSSVAANQTLPAAAMQNDLRAPVFQQQPVLPAGFADYAQPASFESILPAYGAQTWHAQSTGNAVDGFVPYVLVVGSRQPIGSQQAAQQATDQMQQSAVHR